MADAPVKRKSHRTADDVLQEIFADEDSDNEVFDSGSDWDSSDGENERNNDEGEGFREEGPINNRPPLAPVTNVNKSKDGKVAWTFSFSSL